MDTSTPTYVHQVVAEMGWLDWTHECDLTIWFDILYFALSVIFNTFEQSSSRCSYIGPTPPGNGANVNKANMSSAR